MWITSLYKNVINFKLDIVQLDTPIPETNGV